MKHLSLLFTIAVFCLSSGRAQDAYRSNAVAVPHLVRFAGVVKDVTGEPLAGTMGVTFTLYREQEGGAPLWLETQNVTADSGGSYTVSLGATRADGLPVEMFTSGEARWLGVQPAGQAEQPRVLLLSVPYALKAGDAETVGGLPPSAFMLARDAQGSGAGTKTATTASSGAIAKTAPAPSNPNVTGKGGVDFIPMWDTNRDIIDSLIFQKSGEIGINTTVPAATLDVNGKSVVRDTLTLFPKGTDSTLSISGTTFKVDQTGEVYFVPGQKFPGTGTITGVTTALGSGLTGGGTRGALNLSLLKTCTAKQVLQWNGTAWACSAAGTGTITGVTTASGSGLTGGAAAGSLNLSLTTSCNSGQTLAWNGSAWTCHTAGGSGTVTSVGLSAPSSDFTVSGSPVTTGGTVGLNWNVPPTSAATANAIVKRDSSGSFSANNIGAAGAINTGGLATSGNAIFGNVVGIGTSFPQATLNINTADAAGFDALLIGNNSTRGLQLRDTGAAVDLESIGVPLYLNWATAQPTYIGGSAVGIGTTAPQALLNLNYAGNANADTLLIGNNSTKGLQLRDNGGAVDLESIGVPLYVNNVTQQSILMTPGGGGQVSIDTVPGGAGSAYALTVAGIFTPPDILQSAAFANDVFIGGILEVSGPKNFRIDHPMDPTNKYLFHASIESSEVLNQYSGNVVLDDQGEGRVEFPAWFAAINEDFRYQLTAIGAPGPNLHISEEIKDNSFTIAGGKPGMKVSWLVTARRNDAYMKVHPYVVEKDKPERERGYYTDPELYGAPKEQGVWWPRPAATKKP
jgi:hypothetical protein